MGNMKQRLKRTVIEIARQSHFITKVATAIAAKDTYEHLKQNFIQNGKNSDFDESVRQKIVHRFELIDSKVPITTTRTDGLFITEMLFNIQPEGPLIECGCYAGGSSAKLSIISKLLNRELIIFDSFEGLPSVDQYYLRDYHCRRSDEWVTDWNAGKYATRLDEVRSNLELYGELSVTRLVKGWFNETLTDENLPEQIAFAFVDVDLASSARDCFVAIWPRLSEKGIYVTHDAAFIKVLQEIYNPQLWRDKLGGAMPPILFGAGYGLCNESPHLGYMVKGDTLSPAYLKSLTMDK
jgi:O-methyltransferase